MFVLFQKIQVLSVSSDDQMGLVDDLMTLSQGSTASDTNSSESSGPGLTECVNLDSGEWTDRRTDRHTDRLKAVDPD